MLAVTPVAAAVADVEGANDPDGLARFPGSWIVGYTPSETVRSYDFIIGRVDRSHRDVRFDASERLTVQLVRATYRAPDGTRLDDVIDHYKAAVAELDARVAFVCRGRDCGRSTIWANNVFRVKELVAPNDAQFYLAATAGNMLASIYVVQRGNRRVYAHLDVARREGGVAVGYGADDSLPAMLAQSGFAVLDGVTPDHRGALDAEDLQALDNVGGELAPWAGRSLYLVCHLGGIAEPAAALARSKVCAETAAERLRAEGIEAAGFGGGALLPRRNAPPDRVELVLPNHTAPAP